MPGWTGPGRRAARRAAAAHHLDRRPRHQPQLAVGDHGLAAVEPLGDHGPLAHRAAHLDVARRDGAVGLDHEDVGALLAGLHRRRRRHHRVLLQPQVEGDVDELARPQGAVLVGEGGLELDGAGRRVDGVVDEGQGAAVGGAAGRGGGGGELAGGLAGTDLVEVALRHREGHVDGLELLDHDQRQVVDLDHVAGVHQQPAGAAGDRRRDRRPAEVDPRLLEGRLVGLQRGPLRRRVGLDLVVLLGGHVVLGDQVGVALDVGLRLGGQSPVALQARPGGGHRGAVGPRVDGEQRLALADLLALLEADRGDLPGHLRLDLHGGARRHAADHVDLHRDGLAGHLPDVDGDGRRRRAGGGRGALAAARAGGEQGGQRQAGGGGDGRGRAGAAAGGEGEVRAGHGSRVLRGRGFGRGRAPAGCRAGRCRAPGVPGPGTRRRATRRPGPGRWPARPGR